MAQIKCVVRAWTVKGLRPFSILEEGVVIVRAYINGHHFELRRVGMYIEVTVDYEEVWMCEEEEVSMFMREYEKERKKA